ncbi:MAG: SHOCT domain-containing protein [Anaerolineae bacterium]
MRNANISIFFVFTSILALLLLAPFTAQAQTPEAGSTVTVEGQIINATPGGSVPANLRLMLHLYDGMHMADMIHGAADEQGHFRFENVTTAPGRTFGVMVTYQDVTYFSDRAETQPGQSRLDIPVSIYDTTTDPQHVRVEQQQLLLEFTPDAVRVTQLCILSNLGNRAVVDGGQRNLRFRLPPDATDVTFEQDEKGERFVLLEDSFVDTAPVAPGHGTQAMMVSYALPHPNTDRFELHIPVDYPTDKTAIFLPEVGVTLDESEWEASEELLIHDSVHQMYTYRAGALKPGDSLHVAVTGQPQLAETDKPEGNPAAPTTAEVPTQDSRLPIFILGVALSLAMISSGSIWWWRDRRPQTATGPAARDSGGSRELDAVLTYIAKLDAAYEAGTIDEAEYQERRTHLRDQAVDLMLKQP